MFSKQMNLNIACMSFYFLEDLRSRKISGDSVTQRRAVGNFLREVDRYQRRIFAPSMAKTLFSYLAITSLGESRRALENSNYAVSDTLGSWTNQAQGVIRDNIYREGVNFNPQQFLPLLLDLFENAKWETGYGGAKWACIVRKALRYYEISPVLFVDYVVNTYHNGGLMFDKKVLINYNNHELCEFLNFRRRIESILEVEHPSFIYQATDEVCEFIKTAHKLHVIDKLLVIYPERCYFPFITWGKDHLNDWTNDIFDDNDDYNKDKDEGDCDDCDCDDEGNPITETKKLTEGENRHE